MLTAVYKRTISKMHVMNCIHGAALFQFLKVRVVISQSRLFADLGTILRTRLRKLFPDVLFSLCGSCVIAWRGSVGHIGALCIIIVF